MAKAKAQSKKLVHLRKDQIIQAQESFEKLLLAKNEELEIALLINPKYKPSSINVADEIGEYLKTQVQNPRLSALDSAKLTGFETEFNKLLEIESSVESSTLSRFGKYINYHKGSFIASDDFIDDITEQSSIYLTNPKAIEVYIKTEKFVKLWNELVDMSYLGEKTHLAWRLSTAFPLVYVDISKNTTLQVNWSQIKQHMNDE